jgi:hypothetical protein
VFDGSFVLGDWQACGGGNAGEYYILTDWITLAYDGCPGVLGTERAVLLAYDNTGAYTLQSRLQSEGWGAWDTIGTIAAAPCAIPTGVVMQAGGTTTIDVTWDNTDAGLYGSYNGAAPATPILTTFDVWFYEGMTPPVSFTVPGAGWTAGPTGIATTNASTLGMVIPWTAGQYTYMTRRFYAEGIPLPTASSNYTTVAIPSGSPSISGLSAVKSGLNTLVSWTSGDETQVTGYQVFWAPQGGQFSAVGSMISPVGNNNDYTATVRIPATSSFTVKVGAYLTNGSVTYSAPASVKATNIIHDKTRVNID